MACSTFKKVPTKLHDSGGVDKRPRLGSLVDNPKWGTATICRIEPSGKISLQLQDHSKKV